MKNIITVIAVIAITLFGCTKQAKDNFAPQTQSKKAKSNTTLETTATIGLSATVSGGSIVCVYDFGGADVAYSSLQRRYTDPSGQVQTITWVDDTGATSQSSEWMVLQQAIWSWSGPVSGYTVTDCSPFGTTVIPGKYEFRLWASLSDGSVAASDIVTITIP